MTFPRLERQKQILGCLPEQVALDGAFASKANLTGARNLGITNVAFSKTRGLAISRFLQEDPIGFAGGLNPVRVRGE